MAYHLYTIIVFDNILNEILFFIFFNFSKSFGNFVAHFFNFIIYFKMFLLSCTLLSFSYFSTSLN